MLTWPLQRYSQLFGRLKLRFWLDLPSHLWGLWISSQNIDPKKCQRLWDMASLTFSLTSRICIYKVDFESLENPITATLLFVRWRNPNVCLDLEIESFFVKYNNPNFYLFWLWLSIVALLLTFLKFIFGFEICIGIESFSKKVVWIKWHYFARYKNVDFNVDQPIASDR